jgi:hypothetical protein
MAVNVKPKSFSVKEDKNGAGGIAYGWATGLDCGGTGN